MHLYVRAAMTLVFYIYIYIYARPTAHHINVNGSAPSIKGVHVLIAERLSARFMIVT